MPESDSVERTTYLPPDLVQPLSQSERDKRRQFAKALKEKMEEEQGKKRKNRSKDEVVIEHDQEHQEQALSERDVEEQSQAQSESDESVDETDSSDRKSEKIDVKA